MSKSSDKVFVFRAVWSSTCKWITVQARNVDQAYEKAGKRKDIKGCIRLELETER